MPNIDWHLALKYAQLVQIAYSAAPDSDLDQRAKDAMTALGYTYIQSFYANDLATDLNPEAGKDEVSFGYLAGADKELVIAIRGTEGIAEWLHDAEFFLVPCPVFHGRGWTEDGFSAIYKSFRATRDPLGAPHLMQTIREVMAAGGYTQVTVCGHSLGGALTSFLGLDVAINSSCKSPVVYSYASPRPGDPTFAHHYNEAVPNTWRIENRSDLVPKLPPKFPIPYSHVDTQVELVPAAGKIKSDVACMHVIETYLSLLATQAGVGGFPVSQACSVVTASAGSLS